MMSDVSGGNADDTGATEKYFEDPTMFWGVLPGKQKRRHHLSPLTHYNEFGGSSTENSIARGRKIFSNACLLSTGIFLSTTVGTLEFLEELSLGDSCIDTRVF
jgi:hypothetical protein